MMIKFLRHGTGSAAGAARYVLADTDHLGVLREGVKTLRGNAEMFSAIADSCGFKQRYTSGVIAFAPEDDPSDQDIQDVLDSFEELAFAGLEKDDYHLFAVQHDEADGSKHIHVLVPRIHLGTKKSLNIAPPNHSSVFYPWRDFWNETKGWASPKDPARRRRLGKSRDGFLLDKQKQKKGLKLEKDEREFIVDSVEQGVRAGEIKNRTDVESFLKKQFLSEGVGIVSRVVKGSISVRLYEDGEGSKLGRAIRLTGAFFDHDFDAGKWLVVQAEKEAQGEPSQRPKKPAPDSKLAKELQARVDEIKMLRASRQSAYFAYEKADFKDEDSLNLSNLITQRKPDVITDSSNASNAARLAERVAEQCENIRFTQDGNHHLSAEIGQLEDRVAGQRATLKVAQAKKKQRSRGLDAVREAVADASQKNVELERRHIKIVRAIARIIKIMVGTIARNIDGRQQPTPPDPHGELDKKLLDIFYQHISHKPEKIDFHWVQANPLKSIREALQNITSVSISDEELLAFVNRRENSMLSLSRRAQKQVIKSSVPYNSHRE